MKVRHYYRLMNKWMFLRNKGVFLVDHPELSGKKIAMYGLGDLGKHFLDEIMIKNISIDYVVDKNAKQLFADFDIFDLDDKLRETDIMIITPYLDYDSIVNDLEKKIKCNFISLETIVNDLWIKNWV